MSDFSAIWQSKMADLAEALVIVLLVPVGEILFLEQLMG